MDIEKVKKLSADEFISYTSKLVVSYAQEKGCLDTLISDSQEILKNDFKKSIRNIRNSKIDSITKNDINE